MIKAKAFKLQWALLVGIVVYVPGVDAVGLAMGELNATHSCHAFVSKNKRTNPGDIKLKVGASYPIFEKNRRNNPSWLRVRIPNINASLRWVAINCGQVSWQEEGKSTELSNNMAPVCATIGQAETYKLALSWQPAFCESQTRKPECRVSNRKSYQARNFVLHGLWPNKKSCGIAYAYCGDVKQRRGDFCDYPRLNLYTEVREELQQVMPSAKAGSCLQRHQWFKHGTCQNQWSVDEYFELAIDLTRQFNESGIAYFLSRHIGEQVSESVFLERIDKSLGDGASRRMQLICNDGNLLEVFVNLPNNIKIGEDLPKLIARAEPGFHSNCGNNFHIDAIGIGR